MLSKPGKRRVLEEIVANSRRLDFYERDSLSEFVAKGIIEYIVGSKASRLDDLVEPALETCRLVSFIGYACVCCRVLELLYSMADDVGIASPNDFKSVYESVCRKLEVLSYSVSSEVLNSLSRFIESGSTVTVLSYNEFTLEALRSIRHMLDRIIIPAYEPLRHGRVMAERLKSEGFRVFYIPDESLSWAVNESNYILGDAIGCTSAGRIITEAGFTAALSVAESRGTNGILMLRTLSSCPAPQSEIAEILPYVKVRPKGSRHLLGFRILDIVDPEIYSNLYIVSENEATQASRSTIKERNKYLEEIIRDSISYILDTRL